MHTVRILLAAHGEAETAGLVENFRASWRTLAHASEVMHLPAPVRFLICSLAAVRKRLKGRAGSAHNENTRRQAAALQALLNQADSNLTSEMQFEVEPAYASSVPVLDDQLALPDGVARQFVISMIPTDSRLSCGLICHPLQIERAATREQTTVLARLWDVPELIEVHCQHVVEQYPVFTAVQDSCLVLLLHGTLVCDKHGKTPAFHTGAEEKTAYGKRLRDALMALPDRRWSRIEIAYLNHGVGGEWSSPALPEVLDRLAAEGVDQVTVYACEHLVDGGETAGLAGELEASPIAQLELLPCLNEFPPFIDYLARRVRYAMDDAVSNQCCDPCPLRALKNQSNGTP